MVLTKLLADPPKQAVVRAHRQITHGDLRGIDLATGATDGDQRDAFVAATHNQQALVFDRVDGVHDEVKPATQDVIGGRRGEELAERLDLAVRVHGLDPRGHRADLGLAHHAIDGVDLTVCVGDADVVHIDEGQSTDARARQGLRGPRAHAADADDADMGVREALKARVAHQAANPAKPV